MTSINACISSFIPLPSIEPDVMPTNEGFKVKMYSHTSQISSIRNEFETLHHQNYTHVINMPGKLDLIISTGKYYNIICLDNRLTKYISGICSDYLIDRSKNNQNQNNKTNVSIT